MVEIGEGPDVARIVRSPYWIVRRSALTAWVREQGWQQSEAGTRPTLPQCGWRFAAWCSTRHHKALDTEPDSKNPAKSRQRLPES